MLHTSGSGVWVGCLHSHGTLSVFICRSSNSLSHVFLSIYRTFFQRYHLFVKCQTTPAPFKGYRTSLLSQFRLQGLAEPCLSKCFSATMQDCSMVLLLCIDYSRKSSFSLFGFILCCAAMHDFSLITYKCSYSLCYPGRFHANKG